MNKENVVLLTLILVILSFSSTAYADTSDEWWNLSWGYRIKYVINSTQYDRSYWPIEIPINFSEYIYGSFDTNSTRVFEYSGTQIAHEITSQFDPDDDFDAASNAFGTVVFLLNGTTQANTTRTFYIYFDDMEEGAKQDPNYSTNLTYGFLNNNEIVNINATRMRFYIDSNRGENTSGLYYVRDKYGNVIFTSNDQNRTTEYNEYFNGTDTLGFDLVGNISLTIGPVRITVNQYGNETVLGTDTQTGEASISKKYYIYNWASAQSKGSFVKIWQRVTNTAGYQIERNSTPAGALAFDLNRTLSSGFIDTQDFDSTDPYSWAYASGEGGETVGIINLNESVSDFYAENSTVDYEMRRIGIQLDSVNISSSSYIEQLTLAYFGIGGGDAVAEFLDIKNGYSNPIEIAQDPLERWTILIIADTNETIYNRNESVLITANITEGDPYNLTASINATIDMGTPGTGDDRTLVLYDDGVNGSDAVASDGIFTNTLGIPNNATAGEWEINISSYDSSYEHLNSTVHTFNVTSTLNLTVIVLNSSIVINNTVFVDIWIRNYRTDTWFANAVINCSYNSIDITDITDNGNGTYSANFTAPDYEGIFTVYCNATKNGNYGNGTDTFETVPEKTGMNITADPKSVNLSNVTLYASHSFILTANATNYGNGTAYYTYINITVPNTWYANVSSVSCLNVARNSSCHREFNVTAPNNTAPGDYIVNLTLVWTNPDGTLDSNETSMNVTVIPNPKTDVAEANITSDAGDGIETRVGNFTVLSVGNAELENITFNCSFGDVCQYFNVTFSPINITNITVGYNQSVEINVTIPFDYAPGTYNGTINVSSSNDNDTFLLIITVPETTSTGISIIPSNITLYNITLYNNETFSIEINITNVERSSAKYVNISLALLSGWWSTPLQYCGNLTGGSNCTKEFNVTAPNGTSVGVYPVNVTANWTDLNGSVGTKTISFNVTIESKPLLNISKTSITSINATAGTWFVIGNFTVFSIGNDALQNITFNCTSGVVCNNFSASFTPPNIANITVGANRSVNISIFVPTNYEAGIYNGTVNVSAGNDDSALLLLNVSIASNRSWTMAPNNCTKAEYPDEGAVCDVTIINIGNSLINFTISPDSANYSYVTVTDFSVDYNSNYTFTVYYNITGANQSIYNTTFNVDAVQVATPDNALLNILLLPYVAPIIEMSSYPDIIEQEETMTIYANITVVSGTALVDVGVNVTQPNGTMHSTSMTHINTTGNFHEYYAVFPSTWGSNIELGYYNFTVFAEDEIGNVGYETSNFTVYMNVTTFVSSLSSTYLQGDAGSIYYIAKDYNYSGVSGVNVTFVIKDPNNNVTINQSYQTNSDGIVSPLPVFSLTSDAPTGIYTLFAYSTYYDSISDILLNKVVNSTFEVQERTITVTGLFADIQTAVIWYPSNTMKFDFLIYNGEGSPVIPDAMNLTVYDPASNIYIQANMSQMTQGPSVGHYIYQHAMGVGTATGMFVAALSVSQGELNTTKLKAFRVAQGGPYDVRIILLEEQAAQGTYLDFMLNVVNKGEYPQDVFITYWITSNGQTYSSSSEALYTPGLSNQTITRSIYIDPSTPQGTALLNVEVDYSILQPNINVNTTFTVSSGIVTTVTTTVPPYVPGVITPTTIEVVDKIQDIFITRYNSNISLARGMTKVENVVVKNIGTYYLYNTTLVLLGVPSSWYSITPDIYKSMKPDDTYVFLIDFQIPENATLGEHQARLIAVSSAVSDQKRVGITIYASMEEVIEADIARLKEDLQELIIDTKVAEREGKDVSSVNLLIDEIKSNIDLAEQNFADGNFEDSLGNIANSRYLIERARDILSKLVVRKVEGYIPLWIIILIVIIIAVLIALVILKKKKKISPLSKLHVDSIKKLFVIKQKRMSTENIEAEKNKLKKMLSIMEKERYEGIISYRAYNEMKKSMNEKIEKLDKKLSKLKK